MPKQHLVSISCSINNTNPNCRLGMEIWLNNHCILDQPHIQQQILCEHHIQDFPAEHELRFVLKGKLPEHTILSSEGEIVSDATLTIENLCFDGIPIAQRFFELADYTHNFNGTGDVINQKFYGEIGCNGTVSLRFTTPIYLWLLENI